MMSIYMLPEQVEAHESYQKSFQHIGEAELRNT